MEEYRITAKSLGSKTQLPSSPLTISVILGQILSFPLPRFPFYKMETATVTSAQGGGKEHSATLQLVLAAEEVLLHSLSNTECPHTPGAGSGPEGRVDTALPCLQEVYIATK